MKCRRIAGALLAVAALGALVACGGGDDDDGELSGIRTQKGLAVAAVVEGLAAGEESNAASDAAAPLPAAAGGSAGTSGFAQESLDAGITRDAARFGGAPLLQQGADGITVQGFGSATANADSAIVEFYYSRNGPVADTSSGRAEPGSAGGAEPALAPDQQEVQQITEAELQPVIDAIVGGRRSSRGDSVRRPALLRQVLQQRHASRDRRVTSILLTLSCRQRTTLPPVLPASSPMAPTSPTP